MGLPGAGRGLPAVIELRDDGALHLEVRDDGEGFHPEIVEAGSGFVNLRDRLAAVGGELTIASVRGRGTRLSVAIPLRGAAPS
jgi:two-component system sensor histidine kinase UhpB